MQGNRKFFCSISFVVFAVTYVIYSNISSGPFLFESYFVADGKRRFLDFQIILSEIFDHPTRMFTYFSFLIQELLGLGRPIYFRAANVFLHFTNALLACLFFKKIFGLLGDPDGNFGKLRDRTVAWLGALFFLLHPIHTMVNNYVWQRGWLLGCLWGLSGLLFYLEWKERGDKKHFIGFCVSLILALLSHEAAWVFIPLLLLTAYFLRPTPQKLIGMGGAFFLLGAAIFLAHNFSFLGYRSILGEVSLTQYLLTQVNLFWSSLFVLIYPSALIFHHAYPLVENLNVFTFGVYGVGVLALTLLPIFLYQVSKLFSYILSWVLLSLFFQLFLPYPILFEEYRLYFASIGVTFGIVCVLCCFLERSMLRNAVLAIMLLSCAGLTYQRNEAYHSPETIWGDVIAKSPQNPLAWKELGDYYWERGSEAHDKWREWRSFGHTPSKEIHFGWYRKAIACYGKLVEFEPENRYAWDKLLNIYQMMQRLDLVINTYEHMLRVHPDATRAHLFFGELALEQEEYQEAAEHFSRVPPISEKHQESMWRAFRNYERARDLQGQVWVLDKIIEHHPKDVEAYKKSIELSAKLGRFQLADYYSGVLSRLEHEKSEQA